MRETTALGAAIAAGLAVGMWRNFAELRDINRGGGAVFEPKITRQESSRMFSTWDKAVKMCRGWVGETTSPSTLDNTTTDKQVSTTEPTITTTTTLNGLSTTTQPINITSSLKKQQQQPIVTETMVQELTPPNDDHDGLDYLATKDTKMASHHHRQRQHQHQHRRFGSLDADLADADEEDLMLELRKLEILQQLKRMKRGRSGATGGAAVYA